MSSTYYNAETELAPSEWLAIDERERVRLVGNYHQAAGVREGGTHHWAMHVVVENYLAQGFGPARKAIARLMQGGVSRHEAVHALAEAVVRSYGRAERDKQPQQQALSAELSNLAPAEGGNPRCNSGARVSKVRPNPSLESRTSKGRPASAARTLSAPAGLPLASAQLKR